MRYFLAVLAVLAGLAAIVASLSIFVVSETQQALVLQLGKVDREINVVGTKEAGLKFKTPFIQTVTYFDKRILDLDTPPFEIIASGQKRLVVDAFARYRITNPLKFYQAVGTQLQAEQQLGNFLNSALRGALGNASFEDIVRDKRNELMEQISKAVDQRAESLGIDVVDVRIKRADLPTANSEAIYKRMQTERQQEAAQIRAQGEEISRRIRANADREATVVRAEATKKSEILRGEGDAERNAIFASAFNKDPDFFAFYRSMEAYEAGLKSNDTRLVINPNTDFFRYFGDPNGRAPTNGSDAGASTQ
ncbi:MAG: protease modulator HflC [Pseudomonadota bacterium]